MPTTMFPLLPNKDTDVIFGLGGTAACLRKDSLYKHLICTLWPRYAAINPNDTKFKNQALKRDFVREHIINVVSDELQGRFWTSGNDEEWVELDPANADDLKDIEKRLQQALRDEKKQQTRGKPALAGKFKAIPKTSRKVANSRSKTAIRALKNGKKTNKKTKTTKAEPNVVTSTSTSTIIPGRMTARQLALANKKQQPHKVEDSMPDKDKTELLKKLKNLYHNSKATTTKMTPDRLINMNEDEDKEDAAFIGTTFRATGSPVAIVQQPMMTLNDAIIVEQEPFTADSDIIFVEQEEEANGLAFFYGNDADAFFFPVLNDIGLQDKDDDDDNVDGEPWAYKNGDFTPGNDDDDITIIMGSGEHNQVHGDVLAALANKETLELLHGTLLDQVSVASLDVNIQDHFGFCYNHDDMFEPLLQNWNDVDPVVFHGSLFEQNAAMSAGMKTMMSMMMTDE